MIGTTIGKYRIVGQLGRGATGIVYKAIDETLDREVAIKTLNPDLADTDLIKRFRAEATTLAKLNHPEIATIYELLRTESELLMVMELVRGETLEQLSQRGPIVPESAAHLVAKILSALDHAHRAGIVHRDMKPANVMVTESGRVKIMDFGIARVRGAEHMTRDGFSLGTPAYMSPEQVLGEDLDGRADLYSVGVILYRLLTGALPFDAETPMAMLRKHVADPPTALHVHKAGLPGWCEPIVQRALSKVPDERFPTAEQFRAELAQATGTGGRLESSQVFAGLSSRSTSATGDSSGWQTLQIATADTPVSFANSAAAGRSAAKWLRGIAARVDPPTLVQTAKHLARRWEIPLLVVCALVGMVAYSTLGGEGISPIVTDSAPPVTFQAKALVGSRSRERDVTLLVGDGRITISEDGATSESLHTIGYGEVLSVTYSRTVQPMWKSPKGNVSVARSDGGKLGRFGIFVARHWIVLQTDTETEFIVLRVEEGQARRVLTTIAERTGRTPETIVGR